MKNVSTSIELPPFFRGIKLVIGSNDFLREQLLILNETETVNQLTDDYLQFSRALTINVGNGESVIFLKHPNLNPRDIPTIAHEATHAALFLLKAVGIKINKNTDEILAYLIEYISFRILKFIEDMDNEEEP